MIAQLEDLYNEELYPDFNFNGMFAIIIVYALIISAMLAKAISNCFEKQYQK